MSSVAALKSSDYEELVRRALDEDVGSGDVTTEATVPPDARGHGVLVAKSRLVVAGLEVAFAVFKAVAAERPLAIEALVTDGDCIESGTVLAVVNGPAAALERAALVLGEVRKTKSEAKRKLSTPVARLVVRDTADNLRALQTAEADLRSSGFVEHLVIEAADAFSVEVTLADPEPTAAGPAAS